MAGHAEALTGLGGPCETGNGDGGGEHGDEVLSSFAQQLSSDRVSAPLASLSRDLLRAATCEDGRGVAARVRSWRERARVLVFPRGGVPRAGLEHLGRLRIH